MNSKYKTNVHLILYKTYRMMKIYLMYNVKLTKIKIYIIWGCKRKHILFFYHFS